MCADARNLTIIQRDNLFGAHNRTDSLRDNQHGGITRIFLSASQRHISFESSADKLSSNI